FYPFSSSVLVCCQFFLQQGSECLIAVCEGNFTCKENEVCVRLFFCRCRHGYFGANCDIFFYWRCPRQFWVFFCKEMCTCHPNGQCVFFTGQCTCNLNRWGPIFFNICLCKHGKCDQKIFFCTCEPNWWGSQCSIFFYCSHNSQCDQQTGIFFCQPGWWGRGCNNQFFFNNSPCEQFTGRCQFFFRTFGPRCDRYCQCFFFKCNQVDGTCTCEPVFFGKYCREPCPAGFYVFFCRRRCGQCKSLQPCTVADGRCLTCEAGWNGTKCDQPCSPGFYGEGCEKLCPPCKDGHTCNHINGKCSHCNPGWIGDRCETKFFFGTYGENCAFVCSDFFFGQCHFETGQCLCHLFFHGTYCNLTCPPGFFLANCAEVCGCHDGAFFFLTGACHMEANQRMGVIFFGALLALLLILLLSLFFCCCVCRKKDEASGSSQDPAAAKKPPRRLCGRFSRIGMKLPRIPLRHQKLPKVMVAHHDLENTLNCSFIELFFVVEQPSPSWSSRGFFFSFDTTDEGPVYCVLFFESMGDSRDRGTPVFFGDKLMAPVSGEEAVFFTFLKETGSVRAFQIFFSETPLLKSSDSERFFFGSGSAGAALYARVVFFSKQSREEEGATVELFFPGKPPSPERTKPRLFFPATKPKISWIHGRFFFGQSNSLPAPSQSPVFFAARSGSPEQGQGLVFFKRSPSETSAHVQGIFFEKGGARSKEKAQKLFFEPGVPEGKSSLYGVFFSPSKPKQRSKAGSVFFETINGAVQNAFRKMGAFQPERRAGDTRDAPCSPGTSKPRSEPLHPQLASELAAQLKEKTQSLNKGDGGIRANGVGAQLFFPTPPQKAKRSAAAVFFKTSKPLLPTSPHLLFFIPAAAETAAGEPKFFFKPSAGSGQDQTLPIFFTAKKTPIKKPPRKIFFEASLEPPRAAAVPVFFVQ
ncbi:SREC2 protein, partial [Rhodinocichla rosea]|nr:SREC2 protein [Rhodinocichla rosea]